MKAKRFISTLLILAITLGNIPSYTYAANVTKTFTVDNVKTHLTFFGTHYITYTINGVDYDSRTCGTQFNLNVFRNMEDEDKKTVSGFYLHDDRREQFGEVGAKEMCDTVNTNLGYKHAWKVMHDRAQNYCKDLIPYYGGVSAEDDPDRYYNQEYNNLNTFTGDAKKLIDSYYFNEPEAQAFREKRRMMNELMTTGKTAYDNCVKHNEFAREAAVKASSAWLIKFIVENTIVPGLMSKPSATAAGVDSAMNTVYDQVLGMISEITGAENVSVTAEGNIVNLTIGKMGGQNISLKKGAEMVTYMRELAEKNYRLAKFTHEKAVDFHNQLENEAAEVIKKIEERIKKQEEAQKAVKVKEQENNAKTNTANVKPNTARYADIKEPDNSDNYEKEYEAYKKSLINAAKALDADVAALYSQMLSEAESSAISAGFYIKGSYDETIEDDYVQFTFYYPYTHINTSEYEQVNNAIISEEEYKKRPQIYDKRTELLNNCVLKSNTLSSSLNGVYDRYAVLYKELAARKKALSEKGAYNFYELNNNVWSETEGLFYTINTAISELSENKIYYEAELEKLPDEHKIHMEDYENRKAEMQEKLNSYLNAQTNFHLACAMYSDVTKKLTDFTQSGLPDYVYTQKFLPYGYYIPLADGSNTILTSKINSASDKHNFFRKEAKVLEESIDKAYLYQKQKTVAYNYAKYYLRELANIDHDGYGLWEGSSGYLDKEMFIQYGIDPKEFTKYRELENELKSLYNSNYTKAEESGMVEVAKALYADFTGAGTYHNMFLQRYNELVAKAPLYKRKIASGEMTVNSFNYYYADVLLEPYNILYRTSLPPSYTKGYTDINTNKEIAFKDLLYGENGILDDIRSASQSNYTPVESITKLSDDITLAKNGSDTLQVALQPQNANEKDVLWYSENPDIAVVDKNGNVTGVSEGTAVICAVAKDAPFTETQEGDTIYYTCPDEFTARFTITVAKYSLGDADIDNVITATDATNVLQKALINTFELPIEKETDNWLQYVDVDGDTKISANDAALIFRKALLGGC